MSSLVYESFYEATVIDGLETIVLQELRDRLGSRLKILHPPGKWPGVLQFRYTGDPRKLHQLKTPLSVFTVQHFSIPRPKALLGHQYFQKLMEQLDTVRGLMPPGSFQTFYLAAAGADSSVMVRLKKALADSMSLVVSQEEGDLLLRIRHPRDGRAGWESLVRISPRPLSVRKYRVCDYEGALNASIAHAMALLTNPAPEDIILNPACGSGTILIERLSIAPVRLAIGCDTNPVAIRCARANIDASQNHSSIRVFPWDARLLPLPNRWFDVLVADLPFGHDVGSHIENVILYPRLLKEAARVAQPDARFVLVTHEVRMMNALLGNSIYWMVDNDFRITVNGLHPRIYVLRKGRKGNDDKRV